MGLRHLGWFGGTFDPIHAGHLDVARAARRALGLDQVVLVPARVPPHRSLPHASVEHRFAMVSLAVEGDPALTVSDLEMGAEGPSYTASTLDRLAASGVDLRRVFLITGADAFVHIATWKDYPHLLDRCHFVVVSRPGHPASTLRTALPALATRMMDKDAVDSSSRPSIFLVDEATAPVSSTEVRRQVAAGGSLDGLVPPAVAAYITTHRLYTSTRASLH